MLCLYLLGQTCLHPTFLPYLSSETYSRKYEKLPNIVVHVCSNITEKNEFVENVLPANSSLLIYVSTHCVETVKQLEYNRYSQLTGRCSVNVSVSVARGPGFNSRLRQGVLYLIFCFLVLCFYFLSKNTLHVTNYCNSFCNVNLFSILYCKICDRL